MYQRGGLLRYMAGPHMKAGSCDGSTPATASSVAAGQATGAHSASCLGWGEGPDCIRGDLLFWIRDDLRTDDMLDVLLCLSRKLRIMSHRCRHGGLLLASPQQQAMAATMAAAG